MRKIIIISKSSIVSKGIKKILFPLKKQIVSSKNYEILNFSDSDSIVISIEEKEYLTNLKQISSYKNNFGFKHIVIDTTNSKMLLREALKYCVDGFLLLNSDDKTIIECIKKVLNGGKYYENSLLNDVISINSLNNDIKISSRELEVLEDIAKGYSNIKIAKHLLITENTVKKHISNIMSKLGVTDRIAILIEAKKYGIIN